MELAKECLLVRETALELRRIKMQVPVLVAQASAAAQRAERVRALDEDVVKPGAPAPAPAPARALEPEPEPAPPPKVREHDAHVTIRCGGTKLWCARDARDLLKALAAFNKGAPKEKKTKLKAVRKSRRRA